MRQTRFFAVTSFAFAAVASLGRAQTLTQLDAFYGFSQPTALRASNDEQRLFVADGAAITILDTSVLPAQPLPVVARVPVNASIANMLPDLAPSPLLFVAGGTLGLLKVDTTEAPSCNPCTTGTPSGCHPVTVLDDDDHNTPQPGDNEKSCLDVQTMAGAWLVAVFGARGANEVRVYDLAAVRAATGPVAPVGIAVLPPHTNPTYTGTGHAIAVRATKVYVACGGQGLVLVNFANVTAPVVKQGPVFGPAGNPFPGQPGDVRDVAIAKGWLYAAVDGMGLCEIDLSLAWSATMPFSLHALADAGGLPRYCYRLSTVDTSATDFVLGVAANGGPAMAREAIPFSQWGAMSFDVAPGNLPSMPADGAAPALLEFPGTQSAGISPTNLRTVATAEWQSLELRRGTGVTRAYELHDGNALVRDVDNQNTQIGLRPQGALQGKNPSRIGFNLLSPRLLLTTVDSYPLTGPFLATCTAACIDAVDPPAGVQGNFGNITNFDAQWLDPATPGASWLLRGRRSDGWLLQLIQPGGMCGGTPPSWLEWKVDSMPDQYGLQGRLAFQGHVDDAWDPDLILCTRTGTRDGLVAYSRSQLAQVALANMPVPPQTEGPLLTCGGTASVCPVFTADTRPEYTGWTQPGCTQVPCDAVRAHFSAHALNLDCDTFRLVDPATMTSKWVAATATGYHARDPQDAFLNAGVNADGQFFHRAQLVLHDLSAAPGTPPVLTKLYGPAGNGNATDVKAVEVGGSTWVVASDYAGHVLVFDVTTAFASPGTPIFPAAVWTLPPNSYDGLHDNATEVEIDQFVQAGTQHTIAYVACYRRGVEVLDLTNLPLITRVATLDTPGVAEGIKIRRIGASKRLLVACRSGGVQIFAP